ncbi:hypothetical protein GUJ93_ZPchr0013g36316 [Zizania palustris]|uniref:DDT domain-containing protein n=1 Tax=Zizania palustris TaxID=103762 RepID=A0A8J5X1V0_ZIZPA|nr:hypothetical protein GUJ93_ZPchr0013g36316 [Zizania palustris]
MEAALEIANLTGSAGVVVPGLEQPQEAVAQEAAAAEPGASGGARVGGTTCHQCRQKLRGLAASCKQLKKKGKLCPIQYCCKCLRNRYGEDVEEVAKDESWVCPKCKSICNCSLCMKKKGLQPTGALAHTAKASGCGSVHELLGKGSEVVAELQKNSQKARSVSLKKPPKRALEPAAAAAEPLADWNDNLCIEFNAVSSFPVEKKLKRKGTVNNGVTLMKHENPATPNIVVVLPRGTPVTSVAGAELEPEDVGPALQFIEFCSTFSEIFQVRKGQPEKILHDIAGGRGLRVVPSLVAEFHINLLSIIQEGRRMKPVAYSKDTDAWIIAVGKCISESTFVPKELPLDCLSKGVWGYKNLSPSSKLHILNFLCDESLSTQKLKSCMLDKVENVSRKVLSAEEKDKKPEEETKNNMDEATLLKTEVAALTSEENNNGISQIKEASTVKHAAINEKKHGYFLAMKPVVVIKGAAYWKLDGYDNNVTMMLQDFDTDDSMENKDKWFVLNEDEHKMVEDYVSKGGMEYAIASCDKAPAAEG